jgi:DNA-binding GntR family transcriptional regulator
LDLKEPYVIRAALEGLAAERAATRITAEHLARLRNAEQLFGQAAAELAEQASRLPHDIALSPAASGRRRTTSSTRRSSRRHMRRG